MRDDCFDGALSAFENFLQNFYFRFSKLPENMFFHIHLFPNPDSNSDKFFRLQSTNDRF